MSDTHCNCYIVTLNVCFIQNGWTPLMTASFNGHVDIVRILIEAKAKVNTQDEVCCYKITHCKTCICKYIYLCPQNGVTALYLAAQEGKVDVVRLLIDAEAQVNIQTEVHTLLITDLLISRSLIRTTESIMYMNVVCMFLA